MTALKQKLSIVLLTLVFSACSVQLPDEVQIKVKPEVPQSNAQIDVYVELPSHLDKVNAEITDAAADANSSLAQPILLKVTSDSDLDVKTYHYIVPALNEGVYLFQLKVVSPVSETITQVLQVFPNENGVILPATENTTADQTTQNEIQDDSDVNDTTGSEEIPVQDKTENPDDQNSEENIPKDDTVTDPSPDNNQTAINPNPENPADDHSAEIETQCNTACSNLFTVCAQYEAYLTALTGLTQDSCKTQCGTNYDVAQGFMNCVSDTSVQCLDAAGCIAGALSSNN